MGIYDYTIYDMLSRNALCFEKKAAWFEAETNETFTFAHLKKKVDRLAAGLQKNGIKKGDRIVVIGKNSVESFLVCNAAAAVGAILAPLNWRLSAEEIAYNLIDCEPVILFSDKEFQEMIEGFRDKLPSVKKYFDLGKEKCSFSAFDSLMDIQGNFNRPENLSSDDGFVIIYTAAVAGKPRGALLSHINVLLACWGFAGYLNLRPADVHLSILPFFHVAGLFSSMIALQVGALNVNMNQYETGAALKLIEQKKVSVLFEFAPILSQILEQNEKTRVDISSLKAVAGLDTLETIRKYQKTTEGTFYSLYGQTEVSGFATLGRYDERPGSAGKMLPFVELSLVDDYDRQVPLSHTGEIVTRGPMVFKGYWNLPEENEY
ncbi:MAG: AMP-binding protein, partial [Desulfatiglans sp.]|nr:AMP-binding protein [Desulfatiglans sp.]